jgi:hypothetical protein
LVYKLAESDHWSPVINGFSQQAGKLSWKVTPNQFVVLLRGFARLNFVPHHLLTAKCLHQIEKRGDVLFRLLAHSISVLGSCFFRIHSLSNKILKSH